MKEQASESEQCIYGPFSFQSSLARNKSGPSAHAGCGALSQFLAAQASLEG